MDKKVNKEFQAKFKSALNKEIASKKIKPPKQAKPIISIKTSSREIYLNLKKKFNNKFDKSIKEQKKELKESLMVQKKELKEILKNQKQEIKISVNEKAKKPKNKLGEKWIKVGIWVKVRKLVKKTPEYQKLNLWSRTKSWIKDTMKLSKKTDFIKPHDLEPIRGNVIASVENLVLSFKDSAQPNKLNKVIRGASFEVRKGEILAIIGESGSGKSVITSTLYGLTGNNSVIESGKIKLYNQEVQDFTKKDWEKSKYWGNVVSAIFQNPMTTLNPTMKIKHQIMEGILLNKRAKNKKQAYKIALKYLKRTRISNPEKVMKMYPHELSGGMKQRVVISAIVACQPKLIIMDEPTTALDPTIQAEILEIIKELSQELNISILFITHDLGVVASIADRIALMYAGKFLEMGTKKEVLMNPKHPYAWGLLLSMPDVNNYDKLYTIKGHVPSSLNNIVGEAFAPRNDYAMGIDFIEEAKPVWVSPTHVVYSHLYDKDAPEFTPPPLIQKRWDEFEKMKKDKEL